MATKTIAVTLQPTEVRLVDNLIREKKFKNRSKFMEYAARRTIAELALKSMDRASAGKEIDEKELKRILNSVKETRKEIWDENE